MLSYLYCFGHIVTFHFTHSFVYNYSMANDYDPKSALFLLAKIVIALFVLRVVLYAAGFQGYIPVADEVFSTIMRVVFAAGGGQGVLPQPQY